MNPLFVLQVIDFGSSITSIACGRKHTLCYSLTRGSLYTFGLNVKGQLGIGSYQKQNSPVKIKQFWRNFTKTDFYNIPPKEKDEYLPELLSEFIDNLPQVSLGQDSPLNLSETLMGVVAGGLSSYLITCPIIEVCSEKSKVILQEYSFIIKWKPIHRKMKEKIII